MLLLPRGDVGRRGCKATDHGIDPEASRAPCGRYSQSRGRRLPARSRLAVGLRVGERVPRAGVLRDMSRRAGCAGRQRGGRFASGERRCARRRASGPRFMGSRRSRRPFRAGSSGTGGRWGRCRMRQGRRRRPAPECPEWGACVLAVEGRVPGFQMLCGADPAPRSRPMRSPTARGADRLRPVRSGAGVGRSPVLPQHGFFPRISLPCAIP